MTSMSFLQIKRDNWDTEEQKSAGVDKAISDAEGKKNAAVDKETWDAEEQSYSSMKVDPHLALFKNAPESSHSEINYVYFMAF